ncbi:hypothetical protein CVT24_011188 [Panaeolus cyanescens]|uniref:Phospholipase/carboxylesterase/thioesterase domain-containing protein n=1 Tax=Panaeolus cyanescens TaxID=181874 RepID=A0A409VI96_9AGAR|nr:hypothetical protein CVT24_011188 [Panaeolus cyanescens]
MSEVHIRESVSTTSPTPRVKPAPKKNKIPGEFTYIPSDDGTDENLLIMLHGLGDTHIPFSKLGKTLKLPQTAVLALRAPEQVPFLYEEAYQWYTSFDELGELIENPNPTPAFSYLDKIITHLTEDCQWPLSRVHLFGFAQGGSVAAEYAIHRWKKCLEQKAKTKDQTDSAERTEPFLSSFASIVSISGPLLSYPILSTPLQTPTLIIHRSSPSELAISSAGLTAFKKAFARVKDVKIGPRGGMPASKEEWELIMRFWSEVLQRRQVEGLYEVMSGISVPPSS